MSLSIPSDNSSVPSRFRFTPIVLASYALLTTVFWGTFVFDRGLHADTIYIELSQSRPGLEGFLYPYDATRRFMMVPFHLAYLLSDGSYLSLHVVYGIFVWLTGVLTYALVRVCCPDARLVAVLAGAIAVTFGADPYSNLVAVIMVRQAVVAVLAAAVLLAVGWRERRFLYLIPIAAAQGLSLWTYEAGFLMLLAMPLLVYRRGTSWQRFFLWTAGCWAVPATLLVSLWYRYLVQGEASYQSRQLTGEVTIPVLAHKLWTLMQRGLEFWHWPDMWVGPVLGCTEQIRSLITTPLVVGILAALGLAGWVVYRRQASDTGKTASWLLLGGLLFMALSYGPYLALAGPEAPGFRTQFFATPAAAITLASAAMLIDRAVRARGAVCAVLGCIVVGFGLHSGLMSQLEQSARWRPYRDAMRQIVAAAPRLRDDTMILLVNATNGYFHTMCDGGVSNPAFEDTLWFNSGLQVLYPNTRLFATFWRQDGSTSPTFEVTFNEKGARVVKAPVSIEGTRFAYDQMLVFEQDPARGIVPLTVFPADRIAGASPTTVYNAASRILPGSPPRETMRKLAR